MPRPLAWTLSVLLITTARLTQTTTEPGQKRVSPDAYLRAPAAIRASLKDRRCELPETQHWDNTQLNIVPGRFSEAAQKDCAAICIAPDGSTRALIFWGKAAPCPAEIRHGWALEGHFPSDQAGGLYLLKAPLQKILEYRMAFGDPQANPVTHDGVEVGGDKASLIYYCHRGQWLELQGAD